MRTRWIIVDMPNSGSGRTATAVALAWGMHQTGRRVVPVDFDPRGSQSEAESPFSPRYRRSKGPAAYLAAVKRWFNCRRIVMEEMTKTSIAEKVAVRGAQASAARETGDTGNPTAEAGGDDNVHCNILPGQHLARIPVDRIAPAPGGQARQDFSDERLQKLAESLKRSGVREPIIVTPHGAEAGRFQIVAGERRWRAAKLAGLREIPCIVDPGLVERRDKLLAQAEENLHRENLNAVEEAAVLVQLMDARNVEVKEAGELLGRSQRQARRLLQLHTAAAPIKRAVARGQLDARVAIELVRIHNRFLREDSSPTGSGALKKIERLVERYVGEGWTMRKLERLAARLEAKGGGSVAESDDSEDTEDRLPHAQPRERKAPVKPAGAQGEQKTRGPVLEHKDGHLILDVERIEQHKLTPEERATLIALFEDLLFKTRRS